MSQEPTIAHRSYSQLNSWLRCGHAYRLERIEKVPEYPAWWFIGGQAVHSATEAVDHYHLDHREYPSDAELDEIWRVAWEAELSNRRAKTDVPESEWRAGGRKTKAKPNKEDGVWWLGEGRVMLQRWVEWRQKYPNWQVTTSPGADRRPGIELEFNVWFGQVPVRAFVDRLFDVSSPEGLSQAVVVDIKTGSRPPDTAQQLGLYASIIEVATGGRGRPALGCYWDARKGDITVPEGLGRYSVDLFTGMLDNFNKAVMADIFIPNVGQACRTCGVSRYCRAVGGDLADTIATHKQEAT